MLHKDPIFQSLNVQKFISFIMVGGKRSQAENLFRRIWVLIRSLYLANPVNILWKVILRLQTPVLVQRIRIGSRKYQIPGTAQVSIQLKRSWRVLLDSIKPIKKYAWEYAFVNILLEIVWLGKIAHNSRQIEDDKRFRLVLPLFIFKREVRAVEDRQLQHYRWK